jgi:hypothetical protein
MKAVTCVSKKPDKIYYSKLFFAKQPVMCIGNYDNSKLEQLTIIQKEIASKVMKQIDCRFLSNAGKQAGTSIVTGGHYRNSLHPQCTFAKKEHELVRQLHVCLRDIIEEAFGDQLWYQQYKAKVMERVYLFHPEKWDDILIDCMPISGVWCVLSDKDGRQKEHVDDNAIGNTFHLSCASKGNSTLHYLNCRGHEKKQKLQAGQVITGRWAMDPHYVETDSGGGIRASFVLYLDKRIFNPSYTCVTY